MARVNPDGGFIIAAGEVSAFSVCPKAWHLMWHSARKQRADNENSLLGQRLHSDWSSFFEDSLRLGEWMRYLAVLVCFMLFVFMLISSSRAPLHELFQFSYKNRGLQVVLLLFISLWVMRSFKREARRKREAAGFTQTEVALAIDGSTLLPEREYVSVRQGLAGKPDALVKELDYVIPVERKPLARKLRDRYVVQLLVYMRLVEEFEGVRPPHGYLLLGPSCRRIRVVNSESKQQWVDSLIREMRMVLQGADPRPAPHPKKCGKCEVRNICDFAASADVPQTASRIRA
ncbi:MAG: CRISPR-associated protein Cas4 [Pseudomonadota bacterium]